MIHRVSSSRWSRLVLLVFCLTTRTRSCCGDKLLPDLQPPLFATHSGGLILDPPHKNGAKTHPAILRQTNHPNIGDGEYSFSFETEDGVQREEIGKQKRVGDEIITVVQGRFSYKSPEGLAIDVRYTADENGARSSFTFGTDPGRWKPTFTLPGLPGSVGDKGKLRSQSGDSERGYLPPPTSTSKPAKVNNEYLPATKRQIPSIDSSR
ncbi:uncharacterized protein LOC105692387 [Athalia rosae]|uniref:uncharacterized protein LOC105692387 n=1 Tax=Athalia rosae TaxID=37344 RepID=UPI0006265521|nr:uncharacterized protein LOC105692387 [Athalia rosae]